MKKNVLKVLIMLIISILAIGILNNSYAVSVCTIKGELSPNNPNPGQEVTIDISATEINEAIAGLSFTLEYDAEKLEMISATATDLWKMDISENSFTIITQNNEAITNTEKIVTIRLKVKDNAPISESTIKLTHIEVATDDADAVTIEDISNDINIVAKSEQQENKPSGDDNKPAEDKPTDVDSENENNNENNSNNENNNNNNNNNEKTNNDNQNQQPTEKPSTSTEVDNNKIVVVNGNTNRGSSTKAESSNKDASTTNKSLPDTGLTMIYTIAIAVVLIGMGASFIAYRKYKNI